MGERGREGGRERGGEERRGSEGGRERGGEERRGSEEGRKGSYDRIDYHHILSTLSRNLYIL